MKKSLLILLALPLCLTAGCGDDDDTPISSKYTGSRSSKYSNYDSYDYYSSGKTSGSLFSDLSFTNKRISGKNLYVNVRNNGRKTIKGCVKACIYNGSSVVTTVSLYFPSGGLAPGGTAVLDGYIHADVKHYTDIKIQDDILLD